MKEYKEIRKIRASKLRNMCIHMNWYTEGNDKEYEHLLFDLAEDKEIIATEDVVLIAEDIKEHSDTDMSITEICYKVAEAADTFFVEC